eukprot:403362116
MNYTPLQDPTESKQNQSQQPQQTLAYKFDPMTGEQINQQPNQNVQQNQGFGHMQPQQYYQQPQQVFPGQNQQNIPNQPQFQPVYMMHPPMNYHLNPHGMMPQNFNFPPPPPHQFMGGYHMQHPHISPPFLDQRCFNLVKAKKSVKRIGKCQVISGYILIVFNAINALTNFFFLFTLSAWNKFMIKDHSGKSHSIELDEFGIILMTLLKIATHLLLVKWGVLALKTFKPIVKDLARQEMAGLFNNQASSQGEIPVKRSKEIKLYRKQVIKILISTVAITFISLIYTRIYLIDTADEFLEAYYQNQTQSGNFSYTYSGYSPTYNNSGQNYSQNNQSFPTSSNSSNGTYFYQTYFDQIQSQNASRINDWLLQNNSSTRASGSPIIGSQYNGNNQHSGRSYRHNKRDNEIELEFGLDEVNEEEAKFIVHQLISSAMLVIFLWSMCITGCIGACCLAAINRVKKSQKLREAYIINQNQAASHPNIQVATEVSQGNVGLQYQNSGNVNGFQQLPNADDSQLNDSAIIPRGVVVNSIN